MKKLGILIIMVALCLVVLLACSAPSPVASPSAAPKSVKPIVLKYGDYDPANAIGPKLTLDPTFNKLEELSGGRIKVERYYGGSLITAENSYEAILSGICDITKARQYTGGTFLLATIGEMPYAAKDLTNVIKALNELVAKGYMDDVVKGTKFLSITGISNYSFLFKGKKPMNIEELKGIKMRSPGAYLGSTIKALGMVPVTVAPPEVYDALTKGVIDGVMWNRGSMRDYRVHEVGKTFLALEAQPWTNSIFIMNQKSWNSLPPDLQKLVDDLCGEKMGILNMTNSIKEDAQAEADMKKLGVDFYSWPDSEMQKVRKTILPVWEQGIADLNKKGLPGKQIMTEFVNSLKAKGENPPWTP